jgi:hypothetical protein
MKKRSFVLILAAALALALGGCATVNKGTTQTVLIKTDQAGASVYINGELMPKTTPIHVELARGNSYTVDLKKDGFADTSLVIMPVPNEYEDNLFRWGFDYQSGSMTDLTPREIDVTLKKK